MDEIKTHNEEELEQLKLKQQITALQNDNALLKEIIVRQSVQIMFPQGGSR